MGLRTERNRSKRMWIKKEWGNEEELPALMRAFTLELGTTFPIKSPKLPALPQVS